MDTAANTPDLAHRIKNDIQSEQRNYDLFVQAYKEGMAIVKADGPGRSIGDRRLAEADMKSRDAFHNEVVDNTNLNREVESWARLSPTERQAVTNELKSLGFPGISITETRDERGQEHIIVGGTGLHTDFSRTDGSIDVRKSDTRGDIPHTNPTDAPAATGHIPGSLGTGVGNARVGNNAGSNVHRR